ncbi:MAG TPA: hypothetical protein PKE25_14845, partial [Novosphingobium sp.]|nr:hypothetical protein [Novosphingobium sp.]
MVDDQAGKSRLIARLAGRRDCSDEPFDGPVYGLALATRIAAIGACHGGCQCRAFTFASGDFLIQRRRQGRR